MIRICLNSEDEEYNFDNFEKKFLSICKEHKENDRALAFAFILYDFKDAQIVKVLKDKDYWRSLNAISGNLLTVFSIHYKPKKVYRQSNSAPSGLTHFMTSVKSFDNPSESSNTLIDKYFGKDVKVKYPAVMFFQVHDEKIIDYIIIQLDEHKIEDSFLQLKKYISKAVETLKKITKENRKNSKEIFELIAGDMKNIKTIKIIRKAYKTVSSIKEFGTSIIDLVE